MIGAYKRKFLGDVHHAVRTMKNEYIAELLYITDGRLTYATARLYTSVKSCLQTFSKIDQSSEPCNMVNFPLQNIQAEFFVK